MLNKPIPSLQHCQIIDLHQDYTWASCAPNQCLTPTDITQLSFKPAHMLGALASMVSDADAETLDTQDHWLCTQFSADILPNQRASLKFGGLLTFADVYLNGELILQSRNAFHVHSIDVTKQLNTHNQLAICFRAIAPHYQAKQPRGRFPTRLINQRHLRFIRTPVLGYMPGFVPAAKPAGAHRPIQLVIENNVRLHSKRLQAKLVGASSGHLHIHAVVECVEKQTCTAQIVLQHIENKQEILRTPVHLLAGSDGKLQLDWQTDIAQVDAYWPHTHGKPNRYAVCLDLQLNGFAASDLKLNSFKLPILLGEVGFKRIERVEPNKFGLKINDIPLFLRGACWAPMDIKRLCTEVKTLRERLNLLKNAGLNMLRIAGNMPYESDDFYAVCDELGILIYQDFAFANFDYPEDSTEFITSIQKEATDFLSAHGHRACLTVLAGNSEVYQQAAMMGLPLNGLENAIFETHLRDIAQDYAPNIPYVASSPSGNIVPFHAGEGPSHYYGVGGYLRGLDDARLFKGRFAAECLAFAHMPEEASLLAMFNGTIPPPHHPDFKEKIPRDPSSGWDFSDTTDFYLEKLFGVNATRLRAVDPIKYRELCRLTTLEVVERTLSVFRADASLGRAALVWLLHDVKDGAGWGYIDRLGVPKSSFYGLARASQPTTAVFVDEGLEGLGLYLAHDGNQAIDCTLTIALITAEGDVLEQKTASQQLAAHSLQRFSVDAFLGRFVDSSYAYQFGPRSFVAVVAKLSQGENVLCQKVYTEPALTQIQTTDCGIFGILKPLSNGQSCLTIRARKPAFYVQIQSPSLVASDQYFHVMPGFDYAVTLQQKANVATPNLGKIRAANSPLSAVITI